MHLVLDQGLGFFVSYKSAGKGELDARTALWQEFLDRYFPVSERPADPRAKQPLDSFEGKYLSSRRAQTTIMRVLWPVLAEASVGLWRWHDSGRSDKRFKWAAKTLARPRQLEIPEVGGHELLVFKPDSSGRLQMITDDPVEIFQRASWNENKTVLSVALGFAVLVFALTLLLWPGGALLRRHYSRKLN